MDDLMKLDLYELLNIVITADDKEIKSAYRKKALTCHPDKNPDNPKAADLFQQLSKALGILTDKSARAAYDKVLKGRKAAQVRHKELDGKRKKLKEDLEAREKAAQEYDELCSSEKLKKEIDRLRKEGSRLVEEEKELLRQQVLKEKIASNNDLHNETLPPRLKVKWKSSKSDETNGGYNQQVLDDIFKKYGTVTCCVSAKKRGSAILEFISPESAQMAFESEKGTPSNPLTISWICGQPQAFQTNSNFSSTRGPPPDLDKDSPLTSRDYESLVLMKMRQAEERKKLIQKMMEEDNDT